MIAASEIRPITALVAHKSSLPGPFVSLKSQGDANNTAANSRLYKSNTDSRCHFLMTRSPPCVDIEKNLRERRGFQPATRLCIDFGRGFIAFEHKTLNLV